MGCCSFITKPFKDVTNAVGGIFGGGSSSTNTNTNVNTSTKVEPVTNVTTNIDLEPVADILAQSNEQNAQTAKETEQLKVLNDNKNRELEVLNEDKNRQLEVAKIKQFDTYLEHAKNGLILSGVAAGLLYVYKKGK